LIKKGGFYHEFLLSLRIAAQNIHYGTFRGDGQPAQIGIISPKPNPNAFETKCSFVRSYAGRNGASDTA
jgi:hypothetical protein